MRETQQTDNRQRAIAQTTPKADNASAATQTTRRSRRQRAPSAARIIPPMPARLILEDGTVYDGEPFGATANAIGEVVFNTSLTGYQEIATDPSYRFQIVVMTYPHIGNYGIEAAVAQNEQPQVASFVVRDAIAEPSNAQSEMPLADYFARNGISAIQGVDTRALTRRIRNEGATRGMTTSDGARGVDSVRQELLRAPSLSGLDPMQRVTA